MYDFLQNLSQKVVVKKAIYFMRSMGMAYYEVPNKVDLLKSNGYRDNINPALDEMRQTMHQKGIAREDLMKYLEDIEPYLAYLLQETQIYTELVILSLLNKKLLDLQEIFSIPLESLPDTADPKYGIVLLDDKSSANHQGVFYKDKFYYYNPLYRAARDAKTPPNLIQLLTEQMKLKNSVSLRLDQTISLSKDHYKPFMRDFSEVYQGREINLDDIHFPLHPGKNEYFCVYNPETMKKIQFKISHRRDLEHWIEVEELWNIDEKKVQESYITRYLHSIYNPQTNKFVHVDGSFNFYDYDNYKVRVNQQINAHANLHVKQWLVEGEVDILDWGRMILHFFNDPDLILDAFKGKLIEEVFGDI
ncbi:hypothetical protein QFZ28_006017 [Neobacillus niacini]|uniref:hypothetical protein n=1 Tax=Neobacillus niacini TaxID=86668 RepID=UPI002780FC2C|nr:hypothetical protein [Neobacillus niacini]MDQ1005439.1 hypothetical protein [Neobacillus niacini]